MKIRIFVFLMCFVIAAGLLFSLAGCSSNERDNDRPVFPPRVSSDIIRQAMSRFDTGIVVDGWRIYTDDFGGAWHSE